MEKAIQKAIEGGWKANFPAECSWCQYDHTFLDPTFWQCLGKAMGWTGETINKHDIECHRVGGNKDCPLKGNGSNPRYFAGCYQANSSKYLKYWHSFIDHLADGGDIDSFFNNLIQ